MSYNDILNGHLYDGKRVSDKLWLWKNFVDGKPEYWAFDNPYPVYMDNDDPQTLGAPCGYALLKPSRNGRQDISESAVLKEIDAALKKDNTEIQRLQAENESLKSAVKGEFICTKCGLRKTLGEQPKGDF